LKYDFTYNKSAEHIEISKFISYVAEGATDEGWKEAASNLNKDGMLKVSALNSVLKKDLVMQSGEG